LDLFISGLFQALISAIASGAVLMLIQGKLDRNRDDTKKAHDTEKELLNNKLKHLEDKIDSMESRFAFMEQKHGFLTDALHEVKDKVLVVITRQDEFKLRLFELINSVEKIKENSDKNFGKVIVKK